MNEGTQLFTALQVALALGRKRQAIARELESVPPSGQRLVAGNVAKVWAFAALPARLQTELNEAAARRGFRNAEAMLNGRTLPFAEEFEAKVRACPLAQVRAEFVSRALLLRDAMAKPLARQHEITSAELTALGLTEFQRVFGYAISTKHWNRIFDRTVHRDGNAANWLRAELYLDDAALQKPVARVAVIAKQFDHSPLKESLRDLVNKPALDADDREHIWSFAFNHFARLTESCTAAEKPQAKASVIAFLHTAFPSLSRSLAGLRRTFELRIKRESQRDLRKLQSGNFRTPDFSEDIKKIRDEAYRLHGNESLAHRRLRQRGEVSEEFANYYSFDIRVDKSAVPKSVRAVITPQIEAAIDQYKGEREARLKGPAIPRDWSDTLPGDYLSGDDTTLNHPFSTPNEEGGQNILRGEFLLLNDLRTGFPLDHQLIAGHYNGRHIVSGLARVHDSVGLPRKGGYWEKGVWESRWMLGVPKKQSVHWRETELRLRGAGFDMGALNDFEQRHAISPRSKPIERAFKSIQAMMVDSAAFVGTNERLDKFKPLQDFIARCRRGKEDPRSEGIFPMEEWMPRVTAILEEYASEPQNGKMLPGVSPREMWEDGLSKLPLKKLADAQRIGLCTNRRIFEKIPNAGIVLREVPQFVYANEQLRRWQMEGRQIVTFYNIDVPELLTVANLELTEFFTIKGVGLPAMTATAEQLSEATKQIRGFMKPARVLHAQITQRKQFTISKDANPEAASTALGEFHNAEVAAHTEQKTERTRKLNQLRKAAVDAPALLTGTVRNVERRLEGKEIADAARARLAAKESDENQESAGAPAALTVTPGQPKVYVLKTQPASAMPTTRQFWALWKQVEQINPNLNRFALTSRTLGSVVAVPNMNPQQLGKMIEVFISIIRESKSTKELV
jgi:hypothetical protein